MARASVFRNGVYKADVFGAQPQKIILSTHILNSQLAAPASGWIMTCRPNATVWTSVASSFPAPARMGGALGQRVLDDLTSVGFIVWLDRDRLTTGDVWRDEIEHAIDRADVVLALLSAGSYVSDVCRVAQ